MATFPFLQNVSCTRWSWASLQENNVMYFISSTINFSIDIFSKASSLQDQLKQKDKIHDYTQLVSGEGYVFELIDAGIRGYMTSSGKGIKPGDYIVLEDESSPSQYQVEKIDYYSNLPEMWIALLKRV